MGCHSRSQPEKHGVFADKKGRIHIEMNGEEVYLAPGSESEARAGALLPTKPSEDASHLLGAIKLPPASNLQPDQRDFLPNEAVEWVLTVQFPDEPRLNPERIENQFDRNWREEFGGFTAYGLDADTGRWTFLISADGPKAVTRLKIAWAYVDAIHDDLPTPPASLYQRRLDEVIAKLQEFGEPKIQASAPPAQAADRSRFLGELKASFNLRPTLILRAPSGLRFDGKSIWDVMLCLGLQWGDMDCFHWRNSSDQGDDYFFSVETSTPPGYFLPEEIAAGRLQVDDLVFAFSVPRCRAPQEVFEAMVKAAKYCQRRLGGSIVDGTGSLAEFATTRKRIAEIERRLREAGLQPGSDPALRLF